MNQIQDNTPEDDKNKSVEDLMAENSVNIINSVLSFMHSPTKLNPETNFNPNEKTNPKDRLN